MKFARSKNDVATFIFIAISNFCAGLYRPRSSDITVFLSSTITALIPCACLRTVNSVDNSCAGAAINGGVDTRVNGSNLLIMEFRANQVGGPATLCSVSGSTLRVRPQIAAKSQHRSLESDVLFTDVGNCPSFGHSGFALFEKLI